ACGGPARGRDRSPLRPHRSRHPRQGLDPGTHGSGAERARRRPDGRGGRPDLRDGEGGGVRARLAPRLPSRRRHIGGRFDRDPEAGRRALGGGLERRVVLIEWDVEVPVDDGTVLRADVFRPDDDQLHPAILTYGPYGKGLAYQEGYPDQWR